MLYPQRKLDLEYQDLYFILLALPQEQVHHKSIYQSLWEHTVGK